MSDVCPVCLTPLGHGEPICPKCGFHLAGKTQEFKPVDSARNIEERKSRLDNAYLKMVRGPQIGALYAIKEGKTSIGRNPACDIFLNDMTVSREHAYIECKGDAFVIVDDHSFNGVWVNNRTVEQHALRPGDYIQIGKYDFVYEEDGDGKSN